FWTKVMRDLKLVAIDEPFTRLLTQGMVLNEAFVRTSAEGGREYFWEHDLEIVRDEHQKVVSAKTRRGGLAVECEGWTTMSKSKNNGVDPQAVIDRYGADTARLFVMFASPPEQTVEWNDAGVEGANRFLRRVWAFGTRHANEVRGASAITLPLDDVCREARHDVHAVLRQVCYDYERMQYNTVISGAMKMLNALEGFAKSVDGLETLTPAEREAIGWGDRAKACAVLREGTSILLRVLYPACPHITHVLWESLGFAQELGGLLDAPWPEVEEAALAQDEIELVLQVNGKLRGAIKVAAGADNDAIEVAALASPDFTRFAEGRKAKRVIVVPGRLVNVVL
ncbi:MAG: class I tRNA ligase family protein, partial [Burkholderiales bacterium]